MYYFAYGSNLDSDRMKKRKVTNVIRVLGTLKNHKLEFTKEASSAKWNKDDSYTPTVWIAGSSVIDQCDGSIFIGEIKKRSEFCKTKEGFATVTESEGDDVYGALYVIDLEGMKELDKAEGVTTKHYDRKVMPIETTHGFSVDAIVYVANDSKLVSDLLPSETYMNHLLAGEDLLPKEYMQKLVDHEVLKEKVPPTNTTQTNHHKNNEIKTRTINNVKQKWCKNPVTHEFEWMNLPVL